MRPLLARAPPQGAGPHPPPPLLPQLSLRENGRLPLALLAPLAWILNGVVLVFWCRPAIRRYLR